MRYWRPRPIIVSFAAYTALRRIEAELDNLFEINITVPLALAERLSDALIGAEHPRALSSGLFEAPDKSWRVYAHYAERPDAGALAEIFRSCGADKPPLAEIIEPRDWVALSRAKLAPIAAGRFFVHGGHDRAKARGRRTAIEIDAGQAFGTAQHATTAGCLLMLDRLLKKQSFRRVLDLGTGSGILAIATAKACPASSLATDNDPVAIKVARANARLNEVSGRIRFKVAEGLAHRDLRARRFDLAFANILSGPLYRLAPSLARAVRPGGCLVLSGITAEQTRVIEARYRSLGFVLAERLLRQGWAVLLLVRRAD